MNKATTARYKATQKAINELIESVKKSIMVLEKFDNKIVNVKLINELKSIGIGSYVSIQTLHGGRKALVFRAKNREESYTNGQERYVNHVYAQIDNANIFLQFKECNKRLDYTATKIEVDDKIKYLSELLEKYSINESVFSKLEKKFDSLHDELENIINNISSQERQALAEKGIYRYFKI